MKDMDKMWHMLMEALLKDMVIHASMSVPPTDIALDSPYTTENRICADIELDDEELDKGYYTGMSTRKYKDDAN